MLQWYDLRYDTGVGTKYVDHNDFCFHAWKYGKKRRHGVQQGNSLVVTRSSRRGSDDITRLLICRYKPWSERQTVKELVWRKFFGKRWTVEVEVLMTKLGDFSPLKISVSTGTQVTKLALSKLYSDEINWYCGRLWTYLNLTKVKTLRVHKIVFSIRQSRWWDSCCTFAWSEENHQSSYHKKDLLWRIQFGVVLNVARLLRIPYPRLDLAQDGSEYRATFKIGQRRVVIRHAVRLHATVAKLPQEDGSSFYVRLRWRKGTRGTWISHLNSSLTLITVACMDGNKSRRWQTCYARRPQALWTLITPF
jgi:hypothetical protein